MWTRRGSAYRFAPVRRDPSPEGDAAMKLHYHPISTTCRTIMLFAARAASRSR